MFTFAILLIGFGDDSCYAQSLEHETRVTLIELYVVDGEAPGPEDELAMRDDEEATLRLLERTLDEQERMALWMGCFERMPVDEITRALGLTNATGARGLLQRARRKLRAALSARGEEAT